MIRVFMIGLSDNKGGVERYVSNVCSQLPPDDFEIVHRFPTIILDGKEWHCPPNRHNYLKYWLFWKKFFNENHFDVIYSNACTIASIDELRFAKKAGIPIRIIHSHSTGYNKSNLFHIISERINQKSLPKYATHFLACSKKAGEWMFGGQPFEIITNGINLKDYKYNEEKRNRIREILNLKDGALVGVIGRLSEPKNLFFAIDIIDSFLDCELSRHAVIVGDGELKQQIHEYVAHKKNKDRIILTGAVDNVEEWLSAIDVLLMPSLWEGLPFVLVEAQTASVPCLVSNAIPKEADLTGLVSYLNLDRPINDWVKKLSDLCLIERKDMSNTIESAGYSLTQTAKRIEQILKGQTENKC